MFNLDTGRFGAGEHTLVITVTTADGQSASNTFVFRGPTSKSAVGRESF